MASPNTQTPAQKRAAAKKAAAKKAAAGKNVANQTVSKRVTRPDGTVVETSKTPTKQADAVDSGFDRDTFDMEQLRKISQRVAAVIGTDPEIQALFEAAWAGDYDGDGGKQKFWNEIEATKFWQNNAQSVRQYVVLSADPNNPDFKNKQADARESVRQTAMSMGIELDPAEVNDLAEKTMMFDWTGARAYNLKRMIAGGKDAMGPETGGGDIATYGQNLRKLARDNGVVYSDAWFSSAAKSVASGLSDEEFWNTKIRQEAVKTFPTFADQIEAGMNMSEIAYPYINLMYQNWEVNPNDVQLNDPTLLKGLTGYDDSGRPKTMNLGEFAQMLRDDPRYMNTQNAKNEVANVGYKVLQTFGLAG